MFTIILDGKVESPSGQNINYRWSHILSLSMRRYDKMKTEKTKPHAENGEPLFTKRVVINLLMYCGLLLLSICAGVTIYTFFVYAYIHLFTDYAFLSIVNIGGIGIMFYVTWKFFHFFKYQYENFRRLFRFILRESTPFVSARKGKVKEPKSPSDDWIKPLD